MTTTNLTIHCSGMESYGSPTFSARNLGKVAVELADVNIPALIENALQGVSASAILDEIPKGAIIEYLESLGYVVTEEE